MASKPSEKQLNLILKLAGEIGEPAPVVSTGSEASKAIDELLAKANFLRQVSHKAKNAAQRDALEDAGTLTWKQQAAAAPGPFTGKGTWRSAKQRYSQYGEQYKGVFEFEDGRKVWCSIPSSLFNLVGTFVDFAPEGSDRLSLIPGIVGTLTVEVSPSDDDPFFGFGKRPKFAVGNVPEDTRLGEAQAAWAAAKAYVEAEDPGNAAEAALAVTQAPANQWDEAPI